MRELTKRPTAWRDVLLVCRKCSKRGEGGFGPNGRQRLAKALRKRFRLGKGRAARVAVVEVKCLGLCPKGAVTVARGAAPGEVLAVPFGADLEGVGDALGLQRAS